MEIHVLTSRLETMRIERDELREIAKMVKVLEAERDAVQVCILPHRASSLLIALHPPVCTRLHPSASLCIPLHLCPSPRHVDVWRGLRVAMADGAGEGNQGARAAARGPRPGPQALEARDRESRDGETCFVSTHSLHEKAGTDVAGAVGRWCASSRR